MHAYLKLMEEASQYAKESKPILAGPQDVANFLLPLTLNVMQERFYVLFLSVKGHLLDLECVTVGLLDSSQIHAREVFRTAIIKNTAKIVLAHNHPSGDPTPSVQDIECTRSLTAAGKIIGINVIDHIVVGIPTLTNKHFWFSFKEANLL